MPNNALAPQRTCIATRTTTDSQHLLRCVLVHDEAANIDRVIADPAKRLGGRGAWITPSIEALEQATRRRAFARAFRVSTDVDTGHLRDYLAAHRSVRPRHCKED